MKLYVVMLAHKPEEAFETSLYGTKVRLKWDDEPCRVLFAYRSKKKAMVIAKKHDAMVMEVETYGQKI